MVFDSWASTKLVMNAPTICFSGRLSVRAWRRQLLQCCRSQWRTAQPLFLEKNKALCKAISDAAVVQRNQMRNEKRERIFFFFRFGQSRVRCSGWEFWDARDLACCVPVCWRRGESSQRVRDRQTQRDRQIKRRRRRRRRERGVSRGGTLLNITHLKYNHVLAAGTQSACIFPN